jgi:nucleotide-binding universal stress UspA family protein
MFNSIVVAFDGSAHATRALEIGALLASREQVPLGIVYVIDTQHMAMPAGLRQLTESEHLLQPVSMMSINFESAPAEVMKSMAENAARSERAMHQFADYMIEQARRVAGEAGVEDVETVVVDGNPAKQIIAFAKTRGADLIVIGSRGFGALKSLALGSTSNKVAQLADCTCLTVK